MTSHDAVNDILGELERARQVHPDYPTEPVRMVAKFVEEALEVQQAINHWEEGTGSLERVKEELRHAGGQVVRCLMSLPEDAAEGEYCDELIAIEDLEAKGHTHHCACRMVWGDGVCECQRQEAKERSGEGALVWCALGILVCVAIIALVRF